MEKDTLKIVFLREVMFNLLECICSITKTLLNFFHDFKTSVPVEELDYHSIDNKTFSLTLLSETNTVKKNDIKPLEISWRLISNTATMMLKKRRGKHRIGLEIISQNL